MKKGKTGKAEEKKEGSKEKAMEEKGKKGKEVAGKKEMEGKVGEKQVKEKIEAVGKKGVKKEEAKGKEIVRGIMIVDAYNAVLGRLASAIARHAMKNENIVIVNAERAIVNGTKEGIMERYLRRKGLKAKGNPLKGPKFYKQPEAIVRNAIKGMLPSKTIRGRNALKRVKVYTGIPKEFEGKETEKLKGVLQRRKRLYLRVSQISELLGGTAR